MSVERRFDWNSETDVGAVVYGEDEDPDPALRAFVRRRMARGERVVGLLQRRGPGSRGRPCEAGYHVLALRDENEPVIEMPPPRLCNDTPIEGLGRTLEAELPGRPSVLVVNRFGRLECRGEGLFRVMSTAVELGIPTLVPIPVRHFPRWLEMGGGLAVRLSVDSFALERWWRVVGPGAASPPHATFCETSK